MTNSGSARCLGFGDGLFGLPVSEVFRVRLARDVRGHRRLHPFVNFDRGPLQQPAGQLSVGVTVERIVEDGGRDGGQSLRRIYAAMSAGDAVGEGEVSFRTRNAQVSGTRTSMWCFPDWRIGWLPGSQPEQLETTQAAEGR